MRCLIFISIFMVACTLHATTEFAQAVAAQQDNPENECTVCFHDLEKEKTHKLSCDSKRKIFHEFHKACLDEWWEKQRLKGIQQSCPLCNRVYIDHDTQVARDKEPDFPSLTQFFHKMFCECW